MPLTNTQLLYYDSNVLRLPADKRTEYHAQVDRLIAELRRHVENRAELSVTKVVKAGSFAKFTILRRTNDDPIDVDIVFYIGGKDVDHETFEGLSQTIFDLLTKIYPTKKVEDFTIQRRAATVAFVRSGLSVDVVPVLQDARRPDYGWQFDITDGSKNETCAPCQIRFVFDRKTTDPHFRTLVRLGKRWRNHMKPDGLKSFHIELLMAHLLEINGKSGSIEKRFRDFLVYIARSGLQERIDFAENRTSAAVDFPHPVVVVDPVNNANNVTARITEAERLDIAKIANESCEAAFFASEEDDVELWKEVFGPRFRVKDIE